MKQTESATLATRLPEATVWTLHPAEVAVLDSNALALGSSLKELMWAAATALAAAAMEMLAVENAGKKPSEKAICFLCGAGNNGGDGYAAALILQKQGHRVEIMASSAQQHSDEAQYFRQQCIDQKEINYYLPEQISQFAAELANYALLVDCLLGQVFVVSHHAVPLQKFLNCAKHKKNCPLFWPVIRLLV